MFIRERQRDVTTTSGFQLSATTVSQGRELIKLNQLWTRIEYKFKNITVP